MGKLKIEKDPRMTEKYKSYPPKVKKKIAHLRSLILETAKESETVDQLEETLKWGEPSFLAKKGSTIRVDWKTKSPDQYAIYFKCTSKLVSTFREVHGGTFNYENNRAILFGFDDEVPEKELKECIDMALNYHRVKELPRLGK